MNRTEALFREIFKAIKGGSSQACEDLYHLCLSGKSPKAAKRYAIQTCEWLLANIPKILQKNKKAAVEMFGAHKSLLFWLAPMDFDSYLQAVEWRREPEKKFYLPRRRVLREAVRQMQRMEDDEIDLLTISMPPGTGKSTLGIFFLTWIMGKYPDMPNLASAHSGVLTRSFYDRALQIITDPEYCWKEIFCEEKLAATNSKEETIEINRKHSFATLTCRSIDGSLTGATRCEKILYADDLCSGIEEAMSKDRLDKLWNTYTNDLKTRKKGFAKEIHIATRWSVYDVIGRLEREYGNNPRAVFMVLPATDESGHSNFNYDYGVGFDDAYFADMKENLDDASYKALFMNQPIEREGLLYHEDELRRFFDLPDTQPDAVIGVCDTKDRGNDYAVLPVAYVYGDDYYIADALCDNSNPEFVDEKAVDLLCRQKVGMCRFESNSAGGKTAEKVQKRVKERGGNTHITTRFTTANKETRMIVASPWVKEHCLFWAEPPSREYKTMLNFLCSYTMAGKNKHDDVPDAFAMLAEFAQSMSGNKVRVFKRPF